MSRSIFFLPPRKTSFSPLCFLCTWPIIWPPTQETHWSTTTCYGGYRMQRSGLECHPQATECWVSRQWQGLLALLSPWQLNYSLKERKAQGTLLISQWDCWLSSQSTVQWKDKLRGSVWNDLWVFYSVYLWNGHHSLFTRLKMVSVTHWLVAVVDRSCVSCTAAAAFKDTEWRCVGVWIRPSQIYWVHSHHRIRPAAAARVVLEVGDFASCRHQRECVYVLVLFVSGTEPARHAEVNLAYDILRGAESP